MQEIPYYMFDWVFNTALVLSHSYYVLNNIVFIFITAAFKKGISEFACKRMPFNLSRTIFSPFPIPSSYLFLYIALKCCCITRMFFHEHFILGPSTFMCNNTSIFSPLNLLHQSLFTTFIKLKNFFTNSLEYRADK